jgi:hypothetical protein
LSSERLEPEDETSEGAMQQQAAVGLRLTEADRVS